MFFFQICANSQLSPYLFGFSTDNSIPNGGLKSKNMVQRVYRLLFKDRQDLFSLAKGPLGSHSVRKYAPTHMRGCSITKDEKDYCGQWNGRKRIIYCYDDTELPWVDAQVTNALCKGRACKY